mgnify:FL=1
MSINHFLGRCIDYQAYGVDDRGQGTRHNVALVVLQVSDWPAPADCDDEGYDDEFAWALDNDVKNLEKV